MSAAEISALKEELASLKAALDEVAEALEGPCPICENACDPEGGMCHNGRMYFFNTMEKRPGIDPGAPFPMQFQPFA